VKNFNIARLDSKGRTIVPFHIRDYIGLKDGMELIIVNNEKREVRIFPLVNGNTAHLRLMMSDAQGSLSKVMNLMSRNGVDILMSMSRTIERGKLAEWSAIIDMTECRNQKKLENDISKLDVVKKAEFERK
ncbi:MAG: hypothetical protein HYW27_00930, partial [Candidatus Aenigmarchaeota archaeon]|nr:hypothetical protein [Candidatus Aenigmarchaeota archaeon]